MSSQEDQDGLVQQFISVAGTDTDRAKFFLEAAEWNLVTALASFYDDPSPSVEDIGMDEEEDLAPMAVPPAFARMQEQLQEQMRQAEQLQNAAQSSRPIKKPKKEKPKSRIASLATLARSSDEESDEDDTEQRYYAGGRFSGQQIVGPGKNKKKDGEDSESGDSVAGSLMRAAKKIMKDDKQAGAPPKPPAGRRLGDESSSSSAPEQDRNNSSTEVTLRLYTEGFTINDGELRLFTEPANMQFVADVKAGKIPAEFSDKGQISVVLRDCRHEKYTGPAKRPLNAFSGQGNLLGSITPVLAPSSLPTPPVPTSDPQECEGRAKEGLKVDPDQPTTNIQLRLPDGSRLIVRANQSATVGQIRAYLDTARPGLSPVTLHTTYPHSLLGDDAKTLAEAKILNAALQVKLK